MPTSGRSQSISPPSPACSGSSRASRGCAPRTTGRRARRSVPSISGPSSPSDGLLIDAPAGAPSEILLVDPANMDPCDKATYPTLWHASTPLATTMTVTGPTRLELYFQADVPDTDIVVTLYEHDETRSTEPYRFAGSGALRARWRDGRPAKPLEPG